MKNPQDQLFFASGFAVVRNALANGSILTREQRQYCIHAINQHEKLVAERDEWRNMAAVLCGDGGHYHAEHGTAATRSHIEKKLFDRREQHDKLVAMLKERDATIRILKAALLKEEKK